MKRLRLRPTLAGAILASLLLHGLAVLVFFSVSQERRAALVARAEPDSPSIEVEVLADPRAGTLDAEEVAETAPDAATDAATEQAASPVEPPQPDPQRTEPRPPLPEAAELPPAPTPPPRAAPPPALSRLPPARPRAGAAAEGRDDGTTDIILGENTVPPGDDPTAYNIPPRYPPEAVRRGQQGSVQLSVVVATDGTALSVDIVVSSGFPLLDRAAREAVAKWRFRPGRQAGLAMPAATPVTLSFTLVDSH